MRILGPVTFIGTASMVDIGATELVALKRAAAKEPMRRSRICLHASPESAVQEMIIAFQRDSYIRPHRHNSKQESYHLFEGSLSIGIFDDDGMALHWIHLSEGGKTFFRLNAQMWHAIIIHSEFAIIQEVTNGPHRPGEGEFALWAPAADAPEARGYLNKLRYLAANAVSPAG
ncbi:MAG: WbuC family cupin fold metalloprotein [Sedimenticola sp.]